MLTSKQIFENVDTFYIKKKSVCSNKHISDFSLNFIIIIQVISRPKYLNCETNCSTEDPSIKRGKIYM